MGRPREHDDRIASALLDAAERILDSGGADGLSLRHTAAEAGTTTRAVYSLYGSREGLVVALAVRAFEMLGAGVSAIPRTDNPPADLVGAATTVFRPFAVEHRGLFGIAFQRQGTSPEVARRFDPSRRGALGYLHDRVARVIDAAPQGNAVSEATLGFHALCEGLAALELRGVFPRGHEERIWRDAVGAFVSGIAAAASSKDDA